MVTPYPFPVELFELPDGIGRDFGIAGWENIVMGFKFRWEWKRDGNGNKVIEM